MADDPDKKFVDCLDAILAIKGIRTVADEKRALPESVEQHLHELHIYGCTCRDGNAAACLTAERELRLAILSVLDAERERVLHMIVEHAEKNGYDSISIELLTDILRRRRP